MKISQRIFRNPFHLAVAVCLLPIICAWGDESARFFQAEPGFTRAKDLADSFQGKIGAIDYAIKDAFEGATTHSDAEKTLYDIGNKLHINTREATVRRRLLFREGDTVTADMLRETEKNLRAEEFLADAIIEVKRRSDSTVVVKITTYDQWTTVPAFSINRKGGKWVWWVGPVESNLFGTGQRLGFFIGHDLEQDSRWIDFNNNAFTPYKLHLSTQYAWLHDNYSGKDGYYYSFALNRPLLSRTDRWSFSLSSTGGESAEDLYLSGNDLDRLKKEGRLDTTGGSLFGGTNFKGQFENVATHKVHLGITRAFGYSMKTSMAPFYELEARYNKGKPYQFVKNPAFPMSHVLDSLGDTTAELDTRHDELLGTTVSLYQYAYKTVHNFRNLKWSETLETGWRLSASLAENQSWLGARNSDLLFAYTGVYNNAWKDAFFLNSNASLRYFLSPDSGFDNGSASAYAEAQWKPLYYLSTVFSASYDNIFAATSGQQLYLGEESGLIGFPNFYYSGRARALFSAEQRFFPPFEFGTVVPAFAVFLNGGNTYPAYDAVHLEDMHYAVGIGLRLGATRSVQKVVNHINVVWPIGEQNLSGWSWGIRASKSL